MFFFSKKNFFKAIAFTGLAQGIIQVSGLLTGLIALRFLSTNEFALYTIANMMLGTMTILSDSGISNGVLFLGGKYWNDKSKLTGILHIGLKLRKRFAIISLSIITPILFILLRKHNASILNSLLIILTLIPAFIAALSDSLLELPMKLHQSLVPLQKNQVGVNVGRVILMISGLFFFPYTAMGLLSNGIPRILGNLRLRRLNNEYLVSDSTLIKYNEEDEKQILSIVKKAIPGLVYYCLSGQITIWIISIFGNTNAVAQIGALSKLAMILTVFNAVISMLAIPRFAKQPNERPVLIKYFSKIFYLILIIVFVLIVSTILFPKIYLWILGPKYSNLNNELTLTILGASLILLAGFFYSLYSSRGIVMSPFRSITVNVVAIILAAIFFDLKKIDGVLYMNIFIGVIELINNSSFFFQKIGKK